LIEEEVVIVYVVLDLNNLLSLGLLQVRLSRRQYLLKQELIDFIFEILLILNHLLIYAIMFIHEKGTLII
jgi:hypothetical protein